MALDDGVSRPRPWWRRTWFLAAMVALAVALYFSQCRSNTTAPAYETVTVSRGDVISRVSASGSLSATVTVDVGSQVSGRIQSLNADFNSAVRKGQLIAKIDPALYQAAVEQAQANVAAAAGNVAKLRAQSEEAARQSARAVQLFAQKIISENDRDSAVSNARAAAAGVVQGLGQMAQAQAALSQARTNLRYTDILSPTDGIVISRAVNVGQTVAASLSAPVIFTIAQDLRVMEVHTNVAESDIGRLKSGMDAGFTVDAWPGERFLGRIREIRNAPQVVQNVVTYDAVIDVQNQELKLKPGMTATVTVVIDERHDVLRVPNAALRYRPARSGSDADRSAAGSGMTGAAGGMAGRDTGGVATGGAGVAGRPDRAVWVLADGKPARRTVHSGISDGAFTELSGGELKENDVVITGLAGGSAAGAPPGMGGAQRGGGFRIL